MARILLLDLEDQIQLRNLLESLGHRVISGQRTVLSTVDAVLCNGEDPDFRLIVSSLRTLRPGLPVAVVTPVSSVGKMLAVLESGASHYCAGPFGPEQFRWLADRSSTRTRSAAA